MPDLSLNCIVIGDEPRSIFPVKIAPSETVGVLKDFIKLKKSRFQSIDADALDLWQASIPNSPSFKNKVNELINEQSPLRPMNQLSQVFLVAPAVGHVHILVDLPSAVGRPTKRVKFASEDGSAMSPAATSQTAAHGVGRGNPPTKTTLDDAIQQAKTLLEQNSHFLKLAATTDPQLDGSNPFFVDGLGALYDTDPSTKDRVHELFGPGLSRVVFNTSGSGKTRLLVEGLCRFWGFYFTPDRVPSLGSTDFSLSLSNVGSYVEDGEAFALTIPKSPNSHRSPLQLNQTIARTYFRHILLARLLVFEAFLSAGADIPANVLRRRWTHLQLVPSVLKSQFSSEVQDVFKSVYQIIAQCEVNNESRILPLMSAIRRDSRVPSNSPFFVILDEAQLCSHLYEEAFHSEKETGPEGIRPVLREISVAWECFGQSNFAVVYSGTGFSLTRILRSQANTMATFGNSRVFTDTGAFVSQEQQAAYIMQHITLEEDAREEVLHRAWRWLRGRHRFTGEFVHMVRCCGVENASALLTHYVEALSGYKPMDDPKIVAMTHHEKKILSKVKPISEQLKKLDIDTNDCLRQRIALAVNTFMLQHTPYLVERSDIKMIELGFARYTTSSEDDYKSIVIDEPLIIAGTLKYFEHSALSIEEDLHQRICTLPIGPIRDHDLEAVGIFVLAQQLDGTKSLREIFSFQAESVDIGKGKAQLIAIDKINQDGTFHYFIVNKPFQYPLGLGFEAGDPSKHEKWFKGTGVPFCFPDTRSGHDVGFFVLVDNSVVFVMVQFKSYSKDLDSAMMKQVLETVSPAECYKDKNGKIYTPGSSARQTILDFLNCSKIPCLGVLTSFPSNPHFPTIQKNLNAAQDFALFDISKVECGLGQILRGLKSDQFPSLDDATLPEWPVEDM